MKNVDDFKLFVGILLCGIPLYVLFSVIMTAWGYEHRKKVRAQLAARNKENQK